MRLAYFTNTYPRATDTFIRREVVGLRKRGFEVITYSVRKADSDHNVDSDVIVEKNNTQYILPFNFMTLLCDNIKMFSQNIKCYMSTLRLASRTSRPGAKGWVLQFAYFLEAVVLAKLISKDKVDHLHNHFGDNSGTVTLLAAKLACIPYSISIHGPHIFFDGSNWALDKKTKYSKFISCIGYYCKSQMMLYSDKKYWSKFEIIRCGVDLQFLEYREPDNKVRQLLYVGRLSVEKGIPVLFDSLTKLKDQGYNFELIIIGDGGDRGYLEELAKKLYIDEQIVFKGFSDQKSIVETLTSSHIFVLPSFAEGIPVSLMEAMAIGVPVISTSVGGVSELVENEKTGLVVFPSDSKGLASAIARYINDLEFCKTMSRNARDMVVREFDIEKQVDKLASLFLDEK